MIVYNKKKMKPMNMIVYKKWNLWIWLSIIKKMKPMNMIVYNKKNETYEYDCLW